MAFWRRGGRVTQALASVLIDGGESTRVSPWDAYSGGWFTNDPVQLVTAASEGISTYAGDYVIRGACIYKDSTQIGAGQAPMDVYIYYKPYLPLGGGQSDWYFPESAVDGVTPTPGAYQSMEFAVYPNGKMTAPATHPGNTTPQTLSFGMFSMAPSKRGAGSQEGGGYHGYAGFFVPDTSSRWMKCKMLRTTGFRAGSGPPAIRAEHSTGNGTPFTVGELVTCSAPEGTLKFLTEYSTSPVHLTPNLYAAWTSSNQIVPSAGATLTGQESSAVRTVSTATAYSPGAYGHDSVWQPVDYWTGNAPVWVKSGMTAESFYSSNSEYNALSEWDRTTTFYLGFMNSSVYPSSASPIVRYIDDLRLVQENNDDQSLFASIGAFYNSASSNLFVDWSFNLDLGRSQTFKVHVSYSDQHAAGLGSSLVSIAHNDPNVPHMSYYGSFSANGNDLYVAVKMVGSTGIIQLRIPTA